MSMLRPRPRWRFGLLAGAALLSSCSPQSRPPAAASGTAAAAVVPPAWLERTEAGRPCGASADGRPVRLAERGIGGTGPALPQRPKPEPAKPDPTGVAAIITGFGSVCLAGLEVELSPNLSVSVDGAPAAERALRAGQRAALTAHWQDGRPMTGAIAVRHEVVGPIEAVGADGQLLVAGQPVRLVSSSWREAPLIPGTWVAVSGLHAPDGQILASRIDPAPAGAVLLRGRLAGSPGHWRMGDLPVDLPGDPAAATGAIVMRGEIAAGRLNVAYWQPDTLETNPANYFGASVHRFAVEALIAPDGHALASYDFTVALPRNVPMPQSVVPALIGFERLGDTAAMAATSVSPMGGAAGAGAGSQFGATAVAPQSALGTVGGFAPNAGMPHAPAPGQTGGMGFGAGGGFGPGPGHGGGAGRSPGSQRGGMGHGMSH